MNKIIRSICFFCDEINSKELQKLKTITALLQKNRFLVQTNRICLSNYHSKIDEKILSENNLLLSMGALTFNELQKNFSDFLSTRIKSVNLDMTKEKITSDHVDVLFEIIKKQPSNTFRFTYGFNLPGSSPYFPSAIFEKKGFSIGLQPTDLSENCKNINEWLENMKKTWEELDFLLSPLPGYLGIDSSIAPLYHGLGSLINFIKRLGYDFNHSTTTNLYTTISGFIKKNNPRPAGLCGIMFPCLEDYELADEYENGNFSIERNLYLSLHSGVGIDVYPVGINQNREKVLEILRLMQDLSSKYQKPLSTRFVSDGKARVGEKSDFKNSYLKDVVIREL
jgi:uncharacterized protein (UPF0210 family)